LNPGETFRPETDKVFLISRTGMRKQGEMLLNGTSAPQPQQWQAGTTYRLRFININGNNTVKITLDHKGTPV